MKFHSRSALNSIVLSIAMLGYGAAAVAQIPAESLQKLNQKLDKIDPRQSTARRHAKVVGRVPSV
jgi:hypothetical protein